MTLLNCKNEIGRVGELPPAGSKSIFRTAPSPGGIVASVNYAGRMPYKMVRASWGGFTNTNDLVGELALPHQKRKYPMAQASIAEKDREAGKQVAAVFCKRIASMISRCALPPLQTGTIA